MDITLKQSAINTRILPASRHQEVRQALTQPVLKIDPQWYPPYPSREDVYRVLVANFIELLKQYD